MNPIYLTQTVWIIQKKSGKAAYFEAMRRRMQMEAWFIPYVPRVLEATDYNECCKAVCFFKIFKKKLN